MTDKIQLPEGVETFRARICQECGRPNGWHTDQCTSGRLDPPYRKMATVPAVVLSAVPAIIAAEREKWEAQLRECEEALRSTEAQFAEYRKDTTAPLSNETGKSIEKLSWQELLGMAVRNLNEGLRLQDQLEKTEAERDRAKASHYCTCGKEHRPSGMAGTDVIDAPGHPLGPDCRFLTWEEVAKKNQTKALEWRKVAKDREREVAQAKAKALAELREVLEGEIEKLERPNVAGEDLTSASIRAVKAQGIKDALASLADKEAIDKS